MKESTTAILRKINSLATTITSSGGGLSTKVPYTGANQAIDLNTQTLTSGILTVNNGTITGGIIIRALTSAPTFGTLYMNTATPSATNFTLASNNSVTAINGTTQVNININGSLAIATTTNNIGISDTYNFQLGTITGTKIGTATTQKLGFWNATPVVQQTTGIVGAAFVANTSGLGDGSATYGGYTGGQIVAALKLYGLLA